MILPSQLEPYSWLIVLLVLFIDGAIFGLATKKGLATIILIVLGLIVASFLGLSIPFLNLTAVLSFITTFAATEISRIGPIFFSFPILWIIGFLLGIWKG